MYMGNGIGQMLDSEFQYGNTLASFYGKVDYDYNSKYLISAPPPPPPRARARARARARPPAVFVATDPRASVPTIVGEHFMRDR